MNRILFILSFVLIFACVANVHAGGGKEHADKKEEHPKPAEHQPQSPQHTHDTPHNHAEQSEAQQSGTHHETEAKEIHYVHDGKVRTVPKFQLSPGKKTMKDVYKLYRHQKMFSVDNNAIKEKEKWEFVENVTNGNPYQRIEFFAKLVYGNQNERKNLAQDIGENNCNYLAEKAGNRFNVLDELKARVMQDKLDLIEENFDRFLQALKKVEEAKNENVEDIIKKEKAKDAQNAEMSVEEAELKKEKRKMSAKYDLVNALKMKEIRKMGDELKKLNVEHVKEELEEAMKIAKEVDERTEEEKEKEKKETDKYVESAKLKLLETFLLENDKEAAQNKVVEAKNAVLFALKKNDEVLKLMDERVAQTKKDRQEVVHEFCQFMLENYKEKAAISQKIEKGDTIQKIGNGKLSTQEKAEVEKVLEGAEDRLLKYNRERVMAALYGDAKNQAKFVEGLGKLGAKSKEAKNLFEEIKKLKESDEAELSKSDKRTQLARMMKTQEDFKEMLGIQERLALIAKFVEKKEKTVFLATLKAKTVYGMSVDHEYVAKLVPDDQYFMPVPLGGFVMKQGEKLRSPTEGVDALMLYVQKRLADAKKGTRMGALKKKFDGLIHRVPEDRGCHFTLRVGKKVRNMAFLFDKAVSIPQQKIEDYLKRKEMKAKESRDVQWGTGLTRAEMDDFLKGYQDKQKKLKEANKAEHEKNQKEEEKEKQELMKTLTAEQKKSVEEMGESKEEAKSNEKEEEEEEEDDENYTQITTYTLLEVIQKGKKVFGPNPTLSWEEFEGVENKMITKNWMDAVANVFKVIFTAISNIFAGIKAAPRNTFNLFKNLFKENRDKALLEIGKILKDLRKNDDVMKKSREYVQQMQESRFMQDNRPLAKIQKEKVHAFKFLWDVAYQIDVLPGDIIDKDKLMTKILQEKENPNGEGFTSHEIGYISKNASKIAAKLKANEDAGGVKAKYEVCQSLKEVVENVLYPPQVPKNEQSEDGVDFVSYKWEEENDPVNHELRGRLGANILMSIMNSKQVTKELLIGLALSLFGSGFIGYVMDVLFYSFLATLMFGSAGAATPLAILFAIVWPSLTPIVAETFDSFVVKRVMGLSRGKPLFPKTKKELISNLKDALLAGSIAALGSVPFNAVNQLTAGFAWLPVKSLANFLGTATSAAMVPMEIEKMGGHTGASVLMKIDEGFFAFPNLKELEATNNRKIAEQQAKGVVTKTTNPEQASVEAAALHKYIGEKTKRVLRVAKASAMAIGSLGTGATLAFFFGFLMFAIPRELGWISEETMEVGSIVFNSPTEAISMTAQTWAGEGLGAGMNGSMKKEDVKETNELRRRWMSRDSKKNEQMMQLIFLRAMQQKDSAVVPIGYGDVHTVFRPMFTFTQPFGECITDTMRSGFNKVGLNEDLSKKWNTDELVNQRKNAEKHFQLSGYTDEAELIVENWRKNYVYLVQRPRTSTSPNLAPMDLKMETWLKFRKIPFYRLTHPKFFYATFGENLPVIELNGEQIFGTTDRMIEELDEILGKSGEVLDLTVDEKLEPHEKEIKKKLKENEEKFRKESDEVLNRILMYDRQHGVPFFRKDKAIREQMKSEYVFLEDEQFGESYAGGGLVEVTTTNDFWNEYFETGTVKKGKSDWNGGAFQDIQWHHFFPTLREKFEKKFAEKWQTWDSGVDGKGGYHHAARRIMEFRMMIHKVTHPNGKTPKPYAQYKAHEIAEILEHTLKGISDQLEKSHHEHGKHGKFYLFGNKPTPADASLFAQLVQFFETPLNVKEINDCIHKYKNNHNHVFHAFMNQVKTHDWGLNEHGWEDLKKEPAKKLNYEHDGRKAPTKKFESPFAPVVSELHLVDAKLDAALSDGHTEEAASDHARLMKPTARKIIEEMTEFKRLPLPEHAKQLKIGDENAEPRLMGYPPAIRKLIKRLFLAADLTKPVPKGAPKKLQDLASSLKQAIDAKHHNEQNSVHTARALLYHMAAYLCVNKTYDGHGEHSPKDHCGEHNTEMARQELYKISTHSDLNEKAVEQHLQEFVYEHIFTHNENAYKRQLRKLGTRLIQNVRTSHGKVIKWLDNKDKQFDVSETVRNWIWKQLVTRLGMTEKEAQEKIQQAEKEKQGIFRRRK